ncbi:hypothetical protein LF599_07600 [Pseudodesulfovibrio thermohalotolerans]|uniref:hypothetical protein n=1 Tax=Pseudodesulfovibrio thermohalotolerans TaxID=2880651 RepID=UPI0022B9ECC6|nr:hypothetical protein [Pseudodesulfovibrio thermohalotolerans]WFS64019.1 hypothetical protein LF599_07600 [Pseudodesulfovibrio thermohalotolerans]
MFGLSSILSGGVLGVIGSVITNITDTIKRKQEFSQAIEMRKLDIQVMDKEWEYKDRAATREQEVAQEISADDLREASYANDKQEYSTNVKTGPFTGFLLVLVDVVRGLIRPGLTIFLIWAVWDTRAEVRGIMDAVNLSGMTASQALGIYGTIVDMILFLGSTAVTWWFGTRPKKDKK